MRSFGRAAADGGGGVYGCSMWRGVAWCGFMRSAFYRSAFGVAWRGVVRRHAFGVRRGVMRSIVLSFGAFYRSALRSVRSVRRHACGVAAVSWHVLRE